MTRSITAVLMVVAALLAGVALAQPAEPKEPQDDPAGQAAPAPKPSAAERAPDEYEASEQISEDIAVSFPVDI